MALEQNLKKIFEVITNIHNRSIIITCYLLHFLLYRKYRFSISLSQFSTSFMAIDQSLRQQLQNADQTFRMHEPYYCFISDFETSMCLFASRSRQVLNYTVEREQKRLISHLIMVTYNTRSTGHSGKQECWHK